ncbi:hypothetical protein [Bartonella sp. DGB2]|uniref:hypothetical protein n=1 Tax=Bartonella sp. DGB2 TaxID=3388426 RepID=UPI00399026EC
MMHKGLKFFNHFVPLAPYPNTAKAFNQSKNIFSFMWATSPSRTIFSLALKILLPLCQLIFVFILSKISQRTDIPKLYFYALALFIGFSFVANILLMRLDAYFSRSLIKNYELILTTLKHAQLSLEQLQRLSARDLNFMLDNCSLTQGVITTPIFIAITMGLAFFLDGLGGVFTVSFILILIPIALILGMLSAKNYKTIMDKTGQRIEQATYWLQSGAFLRSIRYFKQLEKLVAVMQAEITLRNKDTFLKGFENYFISFGRLLPYILATVLSAHFFSTNWTGLIIWLSIPILSTIISYPQSLIAYKQSNSALEAIRALAEGEAKETDDKLPPSTNETLHFSSQWPIWPSTLSTLLAIKETFEKKQPQTDLENLLKILFFIPEFGNTVHQVLEKEIHYAGQNISDGQRFRLQLLRALHITKTHGVKLHIDEAFTSLDAQAAAQILAHLSTLDYVKLTPQVLASAPQLQINQTARIATVPLEQSAESLRNSQKAPQENTNKSKLFTNIGRLTLSSFLALFIPLTMLLYMANLTLDGQEKPLWFIGLYMILGTLLGALAGFYIEQSLRTKAQVQLSQGLTNIQNADHETKLQIISRDFTTVLERITWYFQDIITIASLLIGNAIALGFAYGLSGWALAVAFSLCLFLLYHTFISALYETRLQAVHGFDALTRATHTAHAFACAKTSALKLYMQHYISPIKTNIEHDLRHFYETRLQSFICRGVVALFCRFLSEISILLIALIFYFWPRNHAAYIFIISAFLLIRADLANAFLAITGFKSQSLSLQRLNRFAQMQETVPITHDKHKFNIAAFTARHHYNSLCLQQGKAYSLRGASGQGKSEYLQAISKIIPAQSTQTPHQPENQNIACVYIGRNTLTLLQKKIQTFDDILPLIETALRPTNAIRPNEKFSPHLLLLDEAFFAVPAAEHNQLKYQLQTYAEQKNISVIVVDHRFNLDQDIEIGAVIAKDAPAQF